MTSFARSMARCTAMTVVAAAALLPTAPAAAATPAVVDRLAGVDRYATAVAISMAMFPDATSTDAKLVLAPPPPPADPPAPPPADPPAPPPADPGGGAAPAPEPTPEPVEPVEPVAVRPAIVYVASGESFPDALAGGPAAAADGAPILLVRRDTLPAVTAAELDRLEPTRIVLLGGTAAVGSGVAAALEPYAAEVVRVAGLDRYETAAAVAAHRFPGTVDTVVLATGEAFPDALAGGAAAARATGPVLLTRTGSLPASTAAELERLAPDRVVVAGGTAAVSERVLDVVAALVPRVDRIAGPDRYATAAALAADAFDAATAVYLATGATFPDALAGVPAAAVDGAPVLLVGPDGPCDDAAARLRALEPGHLYVLGGTAAVAATAVDQSVAAMLAPA